MPETHRPDDQFSIHTLDAIVESMCKVSYPVGVLASVVIITASMLLACYGLSWLPGVAH